jgi:hypothetical protein
MNANEFCPLKALSNLAAVYDLEERMKKIATEGSCFAPHPDYGPFVSGHQAQL